MVNATPFEKYDFKREGLDKDQVAKEGEPTSDYYRGMPVNGAKALGIDGEQPVIGSARDVGNVAAGFVAGSKGLNWSQARVGFDGLEKIKQGSIGASEAPVSQTAQRVGYNSGRTVFER
ncbi:MAG: hypothetical protein ABIS36_19010 [Chryseolinea sp.]